MGSGKSCTGKLLAETLQYNFVDLDEQIEKAEGKSIRLVFMENGEDYFRKKEATILRLVQDKSPIVLATGGGTPCFFDNITFLLENFTCFYLNPDTDLLANRLVKETAVRPVLDSATGYKEILQRIRELQTERGHYYEQADFKISFDETSQHHLHKLILDKL